MDGWLARRTRMSSAFGARFDMETDALLILVLAILAWQYGKAGPWVIASGLLRYLFVAAGRVFPWMGRPLPPSRRGRAICIVQIVTLSLAIVPAIAPPASSFLAAAGLLALSYFFSSTRFGFGAAGRTNERHTVIIEAMQPRPARRRGGSPLAAGARALNISLTFHNIWPTPAVTLAG